MKGWLSERTLTRRQDLQPAASKRAKVRSDRLTLSCLHIPGTERAGLGDPRQGSPYDLSLKCLSIG